MLALGLAAALVASALFNIGIALQGIEARSVPKELALRVSLLTRLFRRKRWVLGWVLGAWGAPAHTEAHRSGAAVIAVVAGLTAAGFYPFFVRGTRFDTGMASIVASGAGFAASNVATK